MLRLNRFIPIVLGSMMIFGSAALTFAQGDSYTVATGDSLDKIAAIYDVQVACLAKTNDIAAGSMLKPGQVIAISFDCPLYDGFDFVTNPRQVNQNVTASNGQGGGGTGGTTTYQVQRGDSLDSIGQTLNLSVVSLQIANNLKAGAILQPGQNLSLPTDGVSYGQFPATSGISNTASGQGGGGAVTTTATDLSNGDATYVVQYQDTMDSIGALFDVKVDCLARDNNITKPAQIYPGQALTVKTACPRYDGFDVVIHPRAS